MTKKKLVILVAPTGGNAMDREGAHVPLTPEEIAEEGVRCLEAGMNGCLAKPVRGPELAAVIDAARLPDVVEP